MTTYEFKLEGGVLRTIHSELDMHGLADQLQNQGGGGYVYDEDTIIPVRRVVCVERLPEVGEAT